MQPSSFHDFLGCREGFGFLAEDCLPHLRGSATSIAPVGCAVDNADRDIVQQEAAAFWHCHDVPAVPISLYSSRFDLFFFSSEHKITFYEYQVIPDNRGLSLVKIEREAAKWPRSRDMLEAEKNDPNDWTELDKNDHTSIQKLTARDRVVTFVWRFDINLLLI